MEKYDANVTNGRLKCFCFRK